MDGSKHVNMWATQIGISELKKKKKSKGQKIRRGWGWRLGVGVNPEVVRSKMNI